MRKLFIKITFNQYMNILPKIKTELHFTNQDEVNNYIRYLNSN
jgi:hypothetical protein